MEGNVEESDKADMVEETLSMEGRKNEAEEAACEGKVGSAVVETGKAEATG